MARPHQALSETAARSSVCNLRCSCLRFGNCSWRASYSLKNSKCHFPRSVTAGSSVKKGSCAHNGSTIVNAQNSTGEVRHPATAKSLIRRRVFRMIDYEDLDGFLLRFQLQSEFVYRSEQGRPGIRPFKGVI